MESLSFPGALGALRRIIRSSGLATQSSQQGRRNKRLEPDPLEETDQHYTEIHPRRQRRTPQSLVIELPAALFTGLVEAGLLQHFAQLRVERMSRSLRQIPAIPKPLLPLTPPACSHRHGPTLPRKLPTAKVIKFGFAQHSVYSFWMKGIGDMKNPSSALARNLEYNLGLMDKQIKRVAELARFLPFADQQEEMNRLAKPLRAKLHA